MASLETFAVFNRHDPIVLGIHVLQGLLTPQMTIKNNEGLVIGFVEKIQNQNGEEVLEAVPGITYGIRLEHGTTDFLPIRVQRLTATLSV